MSIETKINFYYAEVDYIINLQSTPTPNHIIKLVLNSILLLTGKCPNKDVILSDV